MGQKQHKRRRREQRKFNKEIFSLFVVEVSAMDFWPRFKFCMNMAFKRHALQQRLKHDIAAHKAKHGGQGWKQPETYTTPYQMPAKLKGKPFAIKWHKGTPWSKVKWV
jgi:hypothetical protein